MADFIDFVNNSSDEQFWGVGIPILLLLLYVLYNIFCSKDSGSSEDYLYEATMNQSQRSMKKRPVEKGQAGIKVTGADDATITQPRPKVCIREAKNGGWIAVNPETNGILPMFDTRDPKMSTYVNPEHAQSTLRDAGYNPFEYS